jgi:hypothetical protein
MGTHPARARSKTSWRPLRVYSYRHDLQTMARTTYGYRASCECGWLGPVRRSVAGTRADIRGHRTTDHP